MRPINSLILLLICSSHIFSALGDETEEETRTMEEVNSGDDEVELTSPLKPQDMLPTWLQDFKNLVQNPPKLYQNTQYTSGIFSDKESTLSIATSIQNSLEDYRRSQQGSRFPRDCDEAIREKKKSGVYRMKLPASYMPAFHAYCQNIKGEVWMVIQRRIDGKISFDRDWNAYKKGFGAISGEHWLGLDLIHNITVDRPHELLIVQTDKDNVATYAHYTNFMIGNEDLKYALRLLGKYSGNAKDFLCMNAGHEFSTKDKNNYDKNVELCWENILGGWWVENCGELHLNGIHLGKEPTTTQDTLNHSIKHVFMAIRPKRSY